MFVNRKLKKMGYGKDEISDMKIEDIVKLGEMGYTKEDIEALQKEPENDVKAQISSIKEQLEKLTSVTQNNNVRENVADTPDLQKQIDDALNILGGGGPNGGNETS